MKYARSSLHRERGGGRGNPSKANCRPQPRSIHMLRKGGVSRVFRACADRLISRVKPTAHVRNNRATTRRERKSRRARKYRASDPRITDSSGRQSYANGARGVVKAKSERRKTIVLAILPAASRTERRRLSQAAPCFLVHVLVYTHVFGMAAFAFINNRSEGTRWASSISGLGVRTAFAAGYNYSPSPYLPEQTALSVRGLRAR